MVGDRAVRDAVRQETELCGGWAVRGSPRHELNRGGSMQSVRTGVVCGTVGNTSFSYSSMLSGYAFEVAVMYWMGRRATRNNEHVRYTVSFLIGAVSLPIAIFWCGPIAAYGMGCTGETGG